MPVSVSYPGVYLEEIPSGVRSITGVATAIAAFVGRTRRGPTDEAKRIYSWSEYEREYGGIWKESTVSYAVNHYFANGGTDAVIARVHNKGADADADNDLADYEYPATDSLLIVSPEGDEYTLVVTASPDATKPLDFTVEVQPLGGGPAEDTFELSLDPESENYIVSIIGEGTDRIIQLADDDALPAYRPDDGSYNIVAATAPVPAAQATCTILTATSSIVLTAQISGLAGNTLRGAISGLTATGFTLTVTDTGDATVNEAWTVVDWTDAAQRAAFINNVNANSEVFTMDLAATAELPAAAATTDFLDGLDATAGADAGATLTGTRPVGAPAAIIRAASPGVWGDNLRFRVEYNTKDTDDTTLFNLIVVEVDPDDPSVEVQRETFRNLSTDVDSPRYAETVIEQESNLIRLDLTTGGRPAATPFMALSGGDDGDPITNDDLVEDAFDLLEEVDLFTILCIPPLDRETDIDLATVGTAAIGLCDRRNAFFVVDAPSSWTTSALAVTGMATLNFPEKNAAIYFPRLKMPDPLKENRLSEFAPCGVIAGIMARTDAQRGVWKAPAGLEANVRGVKALTVKLTDAQQGTLNQIGVNCIRSFPVVGTVVWGARTLRGADVLADDWKYVPVRRLANYLRESLYRGSKWAVFEPNDEPLWAQIRLSIGSFMQTLFRQGAFQGKTPREAFFVKCDKETTTQADINLGIVNILVGFAPLKPAEFVIIKLQQMAGQSG